ncbi:MAG: hypothetical protein QXZ13_00870 [Candidatus Diapherotrites archaeon]
MRTTKSKYEENKTKNKGMYSIVSAFLLITIIVFAVLFIAFLGSNSIATINIATTQIEPLQKAQYEKLQIQECWNKEGGITKQNIQTKTTSFCNLERKEGYIIEILNNFECQALKKEFGKTDNCTTKLPYYISIPDEKGNKCLGTLTLCYEVKQ